MLVGNYLPRHCGISTFTGDLATSLIGTSNSPSVKVVAMSDRSDYFYPKVVMKEIATEDLDGYRSAASSINAVGCDVVSLQHEYGIFGGEAGSHVLDLMKAIEAPIVTTLHTVLQRPNLIQKRVMDGVLAASERVVVMSSRAIDFLSEVHGISRSKVDLIPHGIPLVPTAIRELDQAGPSLLTFGLLSPDKGIEYVLSALPDVIHRYPSLIYKIVGATHPHVRASAGEAYREKLVQLVEQLGLTNNVEFVDRFVSSSELVAYLKDMDVYITPYLNPEQITSGTLAYAIGAGKAVISTPYAYATELLAEGRGVLVPFKDPHSIALAINELMLNAPARAEMGRRAAAYGREMLWPQVGEAYIRSFERAQQDSFLRMAPLGSAVVQLTARPGLIPDLNIGHLEAMSDPTGIMQHATQTVPNRDEGYCVDDNARALLLTLSLNPDPSPRQDQWQKVYLGFVLYALDRETGRFRNFMSYSREWLEAAGSEDSHGRSLWSVGCTASRSSISGHSTLASEVFRIGFEPVLGFTSPRAWAYSLLGAVEYLEVHPKNMRVRSACLELVRRLIQGYQHCVSADWKWFETSLSYGNARLSQALLVAGEALGLPVAVKIGLESLDWLFRVQTSPEGQFAPIGSDGFYVQGGERAWFDQQPIEACGTIAACLVAYRLTSAQIWVDRAEMAYAWFTGTNMIGESLVDLTTGACCDGLHADRRNLNCGAESTLSHLLAVEDIRALRKMTTKISSPSSAKGVA